MFGICFSFPRWGEYKCFVLYLYFVRQMVVSTADTVFRIASRRFELMRFEGRQASFA